MTHLEAIEVYLSAMQGLLLAIFSIKARVSFHLIIFQAIVCGETVPANWDSFRPSI